MTDQQRIDELVRRVRELEARPIAYPPVYVPTYPWPSPPWPPYIAPVCPWYQPTCVPVWQPPQYYVGDTVQIGSAVSYQGPWQLTMNAPNVCAGVPSITISNASTH